MKKYIKKFGTKKEKIQIEATTWDGKNSVLIVTDKNPNEKVKKQTVDFLLGELDDHDACDKYLKDIKKIKKKCFNKSRIGKTPWNKNLKGEKYLKHFKKGKVWNEGLKKEIDERLKNAGIKQSKTKKRLIKEGKLKTCRLELDEKEICRLYVKENKNSREIGKIFRCSQSVILNRLKKNNIPIKTVSNYSRKGQNKLNLDTSKIKELYVKEKKSCSEISKIFGCSAVTIGKRLKEINTMRRTQSESLKGKLRKPFTKKCKENMSKAITLSYINHPKLRKLRSKNFKKFREDCKKNPIKYAKFMNNHSKSIKKYFKEHPERAEEMSLINKKLWQNKEFAKRMFKAQHRKPNKPEKFMINLIEQNNFQFRYVGDGKIWIGGKCPDFISKNPKKIIEVFGDAFHNPLKTFRKSIPYHQTEQGTIEHYQKYGFETLVIWTSELKNPTQIVNKINGFLKQKK